MLLEKDKNQDHHRYIDKVIDYYRRKDRNCVFVPPAEVHESEWIGLDFLIDKRQVIRYVLALDRRNFYSGVLVGIGPRFVDPNQLDGDAGVPFSTDGSLDSIEHDLWRLDQLLDLGNV